MPDTPLFNPPAMRYIPHVSEREISTKQLGNRRKK